MATISKLVVSLSANSAKLVSELAKSKRSVSKWAKDIRAKAKTVAKVLAVAGAAAAAAIVVIVNRQAAEIDKLAKKAASLNIDTGNLQKLRYQAELSGVAADGLDKSLQKMLKTVSDGKAGLSTANRAFEQLGLSAEQLSTMNADEQFYAIAEAMKGVTDQADKTRIAMDIFGRSGADLVNTLGSDLNATGAEFEKLGIRITSQQAAMVEAYNDSKTKLGTLWDGFLNHVTVQVAPAFQAVIDYISETVIKFGGMDRAANVFSKGLINSISAVLTGLAGIVSAIGEVRLAFNTLGGVGSTVKGNFGAFLSQFGSEFGDELQKNAMSEIRTAINDRMEIQKAIKTIEGSANAIDELGNKMVQAVGTTTGSSSGSSTKKNTDSTIENTLATNELTAALSSNNTLTGSSGGSSAWEKVFGVQNEAAKANLKVSSQFTDYAKALKASINRGDSNSMAYFVEQAQKTLDAVAGRGPNGLSFGNERDHDIDGMQAVLDKLVEQMNQQPEKVGSIDINVMTEDGKALGGKLMGDPAFLKKLSSFIDQNTKNTARAVAG